MIISIFLLAAGNSRRFGSNKLLHNWKKKPLYRHTCDKIMQLINTGLPELTFSFFLISQYPELLEDAENQYGLTRYGNFLPTNNRFYSVYSPKSRDGISYSIAAGLSAACSLEPDTDAYAFFVADQPYLTLETLQRYFSAYQSAYKKSEKSLASLCYQNRPGNPTIFSSYYKTELLSLRGDTGGRKIIHRYPQHCLYVPVSSEQELFDADFPEDLPE